MIFPITDEAGKRYEEIKRRKGVLIFGITGGIASGKSTVAQCLKDQGAIIIDFDVLARKVVRQGERAWKEIVGYFGEDVLMDNKELDRRRMSDIVFRDSEKRKILENFTYPAIGEEFVREIEEIVFRNNEAIILCVVPLLIECHMQALFHGIAVVYIPREKQIQRLIERDGITGEKATSILKAQMPIDEKIRYADFVINNDGSQEEMKRQAQSFWQSLKEIRASRA
jgi:dephospho-CoA kinase